MTAPTRLGLVSLGCDKNTVDSERMLAVLAGAGATRVDDLDEAELILVNTCGFIDAAKEESIETLLASARRKEDGSCRAVVAVGCLVERHREELAAALPEVDLFLGLRDLPDLVGRLRASGLLPDGETAADGPHPGERIPVSSRHVSYLKVSEGCNHGCAFCAIPIWRGRHRSFAQDALVREASVLGRQGCVELNLVAQDLAHYGREFRDGTDIASLVRALLDGTDISWFRLLYIYSAGLREDLVRLMADEPRLLSYIDMPIQHASDPVLERMRRPERERTLREKVAWLREAIPDLTLRTTVLVGFPGETDDDFRRLIDFVEDLQFDRLGAFAFSPQEGTRAAELDPDLWVPADLAQDRLEELLEVQRGISARRLAEQVGSVRPAIVDRQLDAADLVGLLDEGSEGQVPGSRVAVGRVASQADDVDGITLLRGDFVLAPGTLVEARIESSDDYDLLADVLALARAPGGSSTRDASGARELPVLGLETAWGR